MEEKKKITKRLNRERIVFILVAGVIGEIIGIFNSRGDFQFMMGLAVALCISAMHWLVGSLTRYRIGGFSDSYDSENPPEWADKGFSFKKFLFEPLYFAYVATVGMLISALAGTSFGGDGN